MEYARPAADSAGSSAAVLDSDNATNLTRPAGLTSGRACEKVASATEVGCDAPCAGAGARSVKKIVRSQVGNGAVNGESVRTTSQAAITFPNIGMFLKRSQDGRQ
jgi:hypothetical protein